MKWFEVILYLNGKEVYRDVVRSKERRMAITNVLTNKYRGDVSTIEVTEVQVRVEKVKEPIIDKDSWSQEPRYPADKDSWYKD